MLNRVNALTSLGKFLSQFKTNGIKKDTDLKLNEFFFDAFKHQLQLAKTCNSWFTEDNLYFSCENWGKLLTTENITKWIQNKTIKGDFSKTIAVVMAGNIPLVGFHDFISVLISGHKILVKQSSKDKHLLPYIAKYLEYTNEEFKGKITFTDDKLESFDAVIATGSTNTCRYFEYYFKNKPNIIRKNRNSVAILKGDETAEQLEALSNDIFKYFGLGCRSVSKIFVPKGYDFNNFFGGMYNKNKIINNIKYANNYDYNKAVYLMSEFDILENGFLMIKEDQSYSSPIASVFYEYYEDLESLKIKLKKDKDLIQCIVSHDIMDQEVCFGQTQCPKLWEYADNIDTLDFLANI